MNVVLIGAGNVATHLGPALQDAGHRVLQVYSRTETSAAAMADRLDCVWTTEICGITPRASLYVFCVKDSVLESLAQQLYSHLRQSAIPGNESDTGVGALFVHTAGSMSVSVLPMLRRGVLYPMQTFSKSRQVDFREIPLFVESPTDQRLLMKIAGQLSNSVTALGEEHRRYLHLAAVFACNFTNHMYDLSQRILEEHGIPFDVMLPLIDETARKVHHLLPREAQTGPAVRYDENVMNRQLALLADPLEKELYKLLSKSIHDKL